MKHAMNKKFDDKHSESFLKGLKTLTGIPYKKLEKYADGNNLFNILEHPNIIEPNQQQFEKISLLNEFIATYKLLKMQEEENKITLNSSARAGEYFSSILSGTKDREKFMVAFLDNANNIIETRTVSEGSLGEAVVYPRMILKAALDCDCKSIVLSHNHPGGTQKASQMDLDVTEKLVSIFSPLEITVLDHVIVAGTNYYSMAEKGLMPAYNNAKINYEPIAMNHPVEAKEEKVEYENEKAISDINGLDEEDEWEM